VPPGTQQRCNLAPFPAAAKRPVHDHEGRHWHTPTEVPVRRGAAYQPLVRR
jgi:hypothetical protein